MMLAGTRLLVAAAAATSFGIAVAGVALWLERSRSPLRRLTAAPARVVWVEDHGDGRRDVFAGRDRLRLMGYDSEDGGRPAPILAALDNYAKPLFVPAGDRVVFSNRLTRRVFVVDWDGSNLRPIADGFAVDVWRDPEDDAIWVYYQDGGDGGRKSEHRPLRRRRLDDLSRDEPVWSRTPLSVDSFQLSTDGSVASVLTPWPRGGVLHLASGDVKGVGRGCWVAMSPGRRGLFWIFDEDHRTVAIHPLDGEESWDVVLNDDDAFEGAEVYHPRWSNDPRFLVVTGPYREGPGPNRIGGGGGAVEVHVGRFARDYKTVEAWVQVSDGPHGDFYPDLWIADSRPASGPG